MTIPFDSCSDHSLLADPPTMTGASIELRHEPLGPGFEPDSGDANFGSEARWFLAVFAIFLLAILHRLQWLRPLQRVER